jgi:predicted nucleotidyltransferase
VNTAWNKADLIFLMDALSHGMAEASVARFLGRSTDEVRDRAKALKRRRRPDSEKVAD